MKLQNILASLLTLLILLGCNPDDDIDTETSENRQINEWIQLTMENIYYWNDRMNERQPTAERPEEYFYSLLYENDRFSIIHPNFTELRASLSGVRREVGYQFRLFSVADSDDIICSVTYVKKGSPAEAAGLKRGDIISEVNGEKFTQTNFQSLASAARQSQRLLFKRYDPEIGLRNPILEKEIVLDAQEVQENPIHLDTLLLINEKKVGYIVYNLFTLGSQQNNFKNQLDEVISSFNTEGISDLIIDLRYNGGGAVNAALHFASLLVDATDDRKIFSQNKYNENLMEIILNDPDLGEDFLNLYFDPNVQSLKPLSGKIYFLTSRSTASASELLINGTNPFISSEVAGINTNGKNVGSTLIEDGENPSNNYGLLPIIFETFNSQNLTFQNGIAPTLNSELSSDNRLPFFPFGDLRESLLSIAVNDIVGMPARRIPHRQVQVKELFDSSSDSPLHEKMIDERNYNFYIRP